MKHTIILSLTAITLMTAMAASRAATPKEAESLVIKAGGPTIKDESAISFSVLWRIDDDMRYSGTGLTFINGSNTKKPDTASTVVAKVITSIVDSMILQEPVWRGAEAVKLPSSEQDNSAGFKVMNKQGYSLNEFVIRDFSNLEFISYEVKPAFSDNGVSASIDMVNLETADGSNPFLADKTKKKTKKAQGGGIEVSIAGRAPVTIETANLTTEEIEKKLAAALSSSGGYVSSSQLFDDVKDGTTRNVKPFDGHEVQFKSLSGNSIKISVKDPSIGALVKLKYPDENNSTVEVPTPLIFLLLAIGLGYIGYSVFKTQKKLDQEEGM